MKIIFFLLFTTIYLLLTSSPAFAGGKLGVHVFEPEEAEQVAELLPNGGFVTIPIRLDQLHVDRWQKFFDEADRFQLTPLLRLATKFDGANWTKPTRRDIIAFSQFLSSLDWHSDQLRIIAFNEPNHAAEWGGEVNPDSYGETLTFLINWFRTEPRKYLILSAGLDVAAQPTHTSMTGYSFLDCLITEFPDTIRQLDGWVSHAYPNPHFAGSPDDEHKQSVRSYEYELRKLSSKLEKEFPVYITETGWDGTKLSDTRIAQNFETVFEDIWNPDDRVVAVTPFVLSAQEGTFVSFSLVDEEGQPKALYETIRELSSAKDSIAAVDGAPE